MKDAEHAAAAEEAVPSPAGGTASLFDIVLAFTVAAKEVWQLGANVVQVVQMLCGRSHVPCDQLVSYAVPDHMGQRWVGFLDRLLDAGRAAVHVHVEALPPVAARWCRNHLLWRRALKPLRLQDEGRHPLLRLAQCR